MRSKSKKVKVPTLSELQAIAVSATARRVKSQEAVRLAHDAYIKAGAENLEATRDATLAVDRLSKAVGEAVTHLSNQ